MNDKKEVLLTKIFLAFLFLLCLIDWNYGYYQLVRFIGMVGFVYLAYNSYNNNKLWFYIWCASAILINSIVKIALGRTIWNIVDVIWVVLLFISIFNHKRKSK